MHFQREMNIVKPALLLMSQPSGAQFSLQNHYFQKTNQNRHSCCLLFIPLLNFEQISVTNFLAFLFTKMAGNMEQNLVLCNVTSTQAGGHAHDHVHSSTTVPVCTDANPSCLSPLECPFCLAAPVLLPGGRQQVRR